MGPEKGLYLLCSDRDRDRAGPGSFRFRKVENQAARTHRVARAWQCSAVSVWGPRKGIARKNGGCILNPRATSEPNNCRVK